MAEQTAGPIVWTLSAEYDGTVHSVNVSPVVLTDDPALLRQVVADARAAVIELHDRRH